VKKLKADSYIYRKRRSNR